MLLCHLAVKIFVEYPIVFPLVEYPIIRYLIFGFRARNVSNRVAHFMAIVNSVNLLF